MKSIMNVVILLTGMLLFSCDQRHAVNNDLKSDTSKIINMVIDTLASEMYLQHSTLPPPPHDEQLIPTKDAIIRLNKAYKKRTDSLLKKLATDKILYWCIG